MRTEDVALLGLFMLILALIVGGVTLAMHDSAAERAAKRERLEMVMKQMREGGCAPIQIELVRELAK